MRLIRPVNLAGINEGGQLVELLPDTTTCAATPTAADGRAPEEVEAGGAVVDPRVEAVGVGDRDGEAVGVGDAAEAAVGRFWKIWIREVA